MKNVIFLMLLILGTLSMISSSRLRNQRSYEDYSDLDYRGSFLEEAENENTDEMSESDSKISYCFATRIVGVPFC